MMETDKYYVNAPLDLLALLARQIVRAQIPFSFNGGRTISIESNPHWREYLDKHFAVMRKKCEANHWHFDLEFYPAPAEKKDTINNQ